MSLSEFIVLDQSQKKIAVLHQGVLIAKRKVNQSVIFLFQLDNYYVETFFDSTSKQIEEFRMGDNTNILDPYLQEIPIDNLLN